MKRTGLFLMAACLAVLVNAQTPQEKGLQVINQQRAEAHIEFLAGDELEGRESGFRGSRIAADYIVANLKIMGIEPLFDCYYQPFEAYNRER